jgi:methionyl-tRNA formyltransferase
MIPSLRIVFMGTPEFAVSILDNLYHSHHQIVGVVTATDKPAGRGQKVKSSAVKEFAVENNLHLLQPESLKDESFIAQLKALNADLFVVVAFRMLPELVWTIPPKGTINLHASLLPQYRGAAPINWAIINGEVKTGVTTFFINQNIDTGKIIDSRETQITENMSVGELYQQLMELGSELTLETVNEIAKDEVQAKSQADFPNKELKHAPKIYRETGKIHWDNSANINHNLIRGLSPYPGAWTMLYNSKKQEFVQFKLLDSIRSGIQVKNSKMLLLHENGILLPCNDEYLIVSRLQPEGKRAMHFKEFIAGHNLADWLIESEVK